VWLKNRLALQIKYAAGSSQINKAGFQAVYRYAGISVRQNVHPDGSGQ